jgi:hypothetical protein
VPTTHYEFRVAGRLSELAQRAIGDSVEPDAAEPHVVELPPETVILYDLVNETDLHGIVGSLEDLGLHIVSINRVPERRR